MGAVQPNEIKKESGNNLEVQQLIDTKFQTKMSINIDIMEIVQAVNKS